MKKATATVSAALVSISMAERPLAGRLATGPSVAFILGSVVQMWNSAKADEI